MLIFNNKNSFVAKCYNIAPFFPPPINLKLLKGN